MKKEDGLRFLGYDVNLFVVVMAWNWLQIVPCDIVQYCRTEKTAKKFGCWETKITARFTSLYHSAKVVRKPNNDLTPPSLLPSSELKAKPQYKYSGS